MWFVGDMAASHQKLLIQHILNNIKKENALFISTILVYVENNSLFV